MKIKIVVDGISMSHPQPGGYKTYVTNLIQNLAKIDGQNDYVVLFDRQTKWEAPSGWRIRVLDAAPGIGIVYREQVLIPRTVAECDGDVLHSPSATAPLRIPVPLIVTLYDTIELTEPLPPISDIRRWAMRLYSRVIQKNVAKRAARIITISNFSKEQIINYLDVEPAKVRSIYLAPAPCYYRRDQKLVREQLIASYGLRNYVLAIASMSPRKNSVGILKAYAKIPKELQATYPLVFVCTQAAVAKHVMSMAVAIGVNDSTQCLVGINNEQLAMLYNGAALFIYPSLLEGFGLPPLEAMACGTPVVASNTSSIPEVLGDAAKMVTPTDSDALAVAIMTILDDSSTADTLREKGLEQSRQFSWETTAWETLKVYQEALLTNSSPYPFS